MVKELKGKFQLLCQIHLHCLQTMPSDTPVKVSPVAAKGIIKPVAAYTSSACTLSLTWSELLKGQNSSPFNSQFCCEKEQFSKYKEFTQSAILCGQHEERLAIGTL